MFGGIQMHIRAGINFCGECGKFKVVRGEQREGAHFGGQVAGHGPGERQAIEGAGAAADLIHQYEAALGGVVQDVGGFGHLHHKRRAATGQIIAGANAGVDAIERADGGLRSRYVAADVRQHRNQRDLAHVGGFAAHVGAGDDKHAPAGVQLQIVGYEGRLAETLDHRVACAAQPQHRFIDQLRLAPVEARGAIGERAQCVDLGKRHGGGLQRAQAIDELREQFFIALLFARQRALACAEYAILEALEFRRDETLGRFHRLPAQIIGWHLVGLGAGDLDEEPLHAVVAELEIGDAGAFALALLELEQKIVGVRTDAPQLVQLGIEASSDDAAIAQESGGLHGDGGLQQQALVSMIRRGAMQLAQQRRIKQCDCRTERRQGGQRGAQLRQIPWSGAAQRHARQDALQISDAAQHRGQRLEGTRLQQGADRLVASAQHAAVADRAAEPAAQGARAHARGGGIEYRQQRGLLVTGQAVIELEIAARGGIECQRLAVFFDLQ